HRHARAKSSPARRATAGLLAALLLACAIPGAPSRETERIAMGPRLAAVLPSRADLVAQDGRRFWVDPPSGARFEILRALRGEWFELARPRGPLRASWDLLLEPEDAPVRELPRLLAHAEAEGLELRELTLRSEPLVGVHLRGESVRVIHEGVLRRIDDAE